MPDRFNRFWALAALFLSSIATAQSPAQTEQIVATSPEYQERASELLDILKGSGTEEQFFASSFLEAIPLPQFRTTLAQLKTRYGEPLHISRIIPANAQNGGKDGTVEITYAKAIVAVRMVLDDSPPYPVIGLQVTGANVTDDNIAKITQEFRDLPGIAGFEIADLDSNQPTMLESLNRDQQFAVGSTFKLYVLAALSRAIAQGDRNWNDVVPLSRKSLPSGILQNWPSDSPLTLQTLATLMISISDNSATDILMEQLGSESINRIVLESGHSAPEKTLPMLKTIETFALKMPGNEDLRSRYLTASDGQQMQLLQEHSNQLNVESTAIGNFANNPRHIETIGWFAAPSDVTGILNLINQIEDPVVHEILKMNPMIPPADALRWNYLGGKGGSLPGVISFAFLAKSKSGKSYAVSGSWNNKETPVDAEMFITMMNRLLNLTAER